MYEIASNIICNYFNAFEEREQFKNIINFIKGKKPEDIVEDYHEGYEKYLTIACLNYEENNYASPDKMLIANHDILMVMDGASSGDTYFSSYGIVGSTLSKIEAINENYIPEYIFFTLKKYKNDIRSQTIGSAIPHTNKDVVLNLVIPKVDLNEQIKFKYLLDKILNNSEENKRLSELRDTLLPKLINGEIDLDKIEI